MKTVRHAAFDLFRERGMTTILADGFAQAAALAQDGRRVVQLDVAPGMALA